MPNMPNVPKFFKAFRIAVVLQTIAIFGQAITAGLLLSSPDGRILHGAFAGVVFLTALFQLVAGILVWRPGGGDGRYAAQSVGIFVVVLAQAGLGMAGITEVHVPLGVLLWGGTLVLLTQVMAIGRRASVEASAA